MAPADAPAASSFTVTTSLADGDGDGVADTCDNCPNVANANQGRKPLLRQHHCLGVSDNFNVGRAGAPRDEGELAEHRRRLQMRDRLAMIVLSHPHSQAPGSQEVE